VSTAQLQKAMLAIGPGSAGAAATDPATALAKELGISAAKVRAAMQALRPGGAPPSGAQPPSGGQTAPQGQTSAA
jgi:hypothetical protein